MKPLWNHQVEAIRRGLTSQDIFLAMEMGTGKSRTTIEILRRRYHENGRLMKTLIISPVIVCDNWKREFGMYSKINQKDIIVLTQSGKVRCREFIKAVGDNLERAKIIITNYNGLLMDDLYALINQWKPEILVVDESHKVKGHTSKTAKKLMFVSDNTKHNILLTGTPILNSPADLWMQFRVLDSGDTFGKNFFAFRAQYFRDANAQWAGKQGYFPKFVPAPGAYETIQEKIKPKMMRALKKDCLDLPPLVRQEVRVELSTEQKRMYKEMKDEFVAFVEDQKKKQNLTVVANLAVTKAMRLQQIVTGYANTVEHGEVRLADIPRLKALEELLEDITPEHKVIVWAVFKENYRMIKDLCERMKIEYAEIHGDISNAQRIEEMDRFRTDPKCRVVIANQSAGGAGINLVEASYSIYYSKGYSLEHELQSESRNHRGGSEIHDKITRIDLVAPGTIDELINDALQRKQSVADVILDWKDKL